MGNLGKLCYRKGGNALAYKKNGNALIYKGQGARVVTVRVRWHPQSYVCQMYDTYHEIELVCSGLWTNGTGSIVSTTTGGTETVLKLKVTNGPATFRINTACSSPCADQTEDPGATCDIYVSQRGATPRVKKDVSAPRTETGSAATHTFIEFDEDCLLEGFS